MRSRNEKEKTQRREAMLDAAQRVFIAKGFEQAAMDDIASEAELSRGLLYVYFKDKQGIYDALRVRAIEVLGNRMETYTNEHSLGIDKLKACGLSFYHFYTFDRPLYDCLHHGITTTIEASAAISVERGEEVKRVEKSVMSIMTGAIQTGWDDGSVRKDLTDDSLELALYMRGSLQGMILLQSLTGSAMLEQALFSREEFVLRGIERMTNQVATIRGA